MAGDEPDDRIDDGARVEDEDSEGDVIEGGDADEVETREFEEEDEDEDVEVDEDGGSGGEAFEIERTTTREEAAALLHDLADGVASGSVAFDEGALVVDIPETVDLEVEYEREDDESEIEVELEWAREGDVDHSAEIETDDGETGDSGAGIENTPDGAQESEDAVEDREIGAEDREETVESNDETSELGDETAGEGDETNEEGDEAVDAAESEVGSGVESGDTAEPDVESEDTAEPGTESTGVSESGVAGLVEPGGVARSRARFELYRDRADKWHWRLVHHNGNIIADGGGGYARKANARKGLDSVKRNAPGALVVENE